MAQFNYQSLTQPILPQPPAPNTLDKWYVERLPYIVQPLGNAWAIAGSFMAEARELLPLPAAAASVTFAGFQQQSYYLTIPYLNPTLSAAAASTVLGSSMDGLNEEHTYVDKYEAYWRWPYPQTPTAATRLISGPIGPVFPLAFVAAPAVTGFLPSNFPFEAVTRRPDYTAIDSEEGSYHLLQFIPITLDKFAAKDYSLFAPKKLDYASVITAYNGQVSPVFPQAAAILIGNVASWFQEWQPQWQRPTPIPALANVQSHVEPLLHQPFVAVSVVGLPWWQQEVMQQWMANQLDWLKTYSGSVSNVLPIPFIAPPPPPKVCPPPTGPDGDITLSYFGGARPLAVLFCRICQSGKPLLVRGDYAIWCQDCCAFVSKADTVMMTVRAPGQLKGIF